MHLEGGIVSISHTISTTMEYFPAIERVRDSKLRAILVDLEILPGITAWEKQVEEGGRGWEKLVKGVKRSNFQL